MAQHTAGAPTGRSATGVDGWPAAGVDGRPVLDAVIIGAGLSGLSLAGHLAASGWHDRRVLVVDDGGAGAPEAWAYWSAGEQLLDRAACAGYRQVMVHDGAAGRVLPLGGYRYRVVRRQDLRRAVTALTAGCPGYRFRTGRVGGLRSDPHGAGVLVDGEAVAARWVFDSRPGRPAGVVRGGSAAPDAVLAFTGWEVRCAGEVFDPRLPTLMDFRAPQLGGVGFGYVLPSDARTALVEVTVFVPRGRRVPTAEQTGAAVAGYLADVFGHRDPQVLRTESGVLPLHVTPPGRRHGSVLAIGARAGLVRASTGYAYPAVQADSAAIAASLVLHGHPFALRRPSRWYRALDAVLLEVLARDPAALRGAFGRLFAANPAERVLRFLDGRAGAVDQARIIASMPTAPFLRALGPAALRRVRR